MLNPDIDQVSDDLATAYLSILGVERFAYSVMNTRIGVLSPDPPWLGAVRTEMAALSKAGAQWQKQRPEVWAPILHALGNYSSLISGVASVSVQFGDDKGKWIDVLNQLSSALDDIADTVESAERLFTHLVKELDLDETILDQSLKKAWSELADEEQAMVDLATAIGALQEHIDNLEGSLTAGQISSGQSIIMSEVSIAYTLVETGVDEIPFLTIVGLLFSIGKGAYDIFVTDAEINAAIDKISKLRLNASQQAQAAAMSKAIIQMIDGFDKTLAAIQSQLPRLSEVFQSERQKIQVAIDGLNAGAKPSLMLDLIALPVAAVSWKQLADFGDKLKRSPQLGPPAILSTDPSARILSTDPSASKK